MVRTSLTKAWVLVVDRSGLASIAATAIQRIFYFPHIYHAIRRKQGNLRLLVLLKDSSSVLKWKEKWRLVGKKKSIVSMVLDED